ncbi:MAG: signal peptidase I [Sarcina sp.]
MGAIAIVIFFNSKYIFLISKGNSMEPYLKENDITLNYKVDETTEIAINDIVTFYDYNSNQLVQHRVIETLSIENDKFVITKGDNNLAEDNLINLKDIKYVCVQKKYNE